MNVVAIAIAFFAAVTPQSATITVTASRTPTRLADTPSSVVVLSRETLDATAALTADDALRQVPGFTLFRRSGSRTANPTSQGVSLRGIGASGASRALVLDDGIPLNDPFGGWVYWSRIPLVAMDRVEVVRGGASDLYGSAAMGGVIQFLRRTSDTMAVDLSAGSQETASGSLYAALTRGAWRGSIAADLFSTGGHVLVDRAQRGAVDREATSKHTAIDLTIERSFENSRRGFLRASHFNESRNNGTALQINDTRMRQIAAGADAGPLTVRAYTSTQRYHQTFSAIGAGRATERLTVDQRVPSRAWGGSAQYAHAAGNRVALVAGGDVRNVTGNSGERQRTRAAFAEGTVVASTKMTATASLRYDAWQDDQSWSPRLSAIFRANDRLALTASAYRAFRAPTLNELYRSFRVGNVLTLANPSLGAEHLSAFEVGARSGPFRVTLFSMTTSDSIANITLSTTPSLITRQRRNIGSSRSRGAEIESDMRIANDWRISAGFLFADAKISGGRRTPQVPRNQATLQIGYRSLAGVQARWSAMQFDDDLNLLRLRGYFTADTFVAHPIVSRLDATFAVENIFNQRIEAGATPVITLGQPRAVRIGLRFRKVN